MKALSIDRSTCMQDGICAEECPALVIAMDGGDGFPAPASGFERLCFDCGHCVAVCPTGAKSVATAGVDCSIALTYLELAAFSMGLGACWAGWFNFAANHHPPLTEALRLPEGHAVFGAMMLGHPRHGYQRIPPRKEPAIAWR